MQHLKHFVGKCRFYKREPIQLRFFENLAVLLNLFSIMTQISSTKFIVTRVALQDEKIIINQQKHLNDEYFIISYIMFVHNIDEIVFMV